MKAANKIGLGGLMLLGIWFGSFANRKFTSRAEELGYNGARIAMGVGGVWLLVAGVLQRRKESGVGHPSSKPTPVPRASVPRIPVTPIQRPREAPPKDPSDGPKLLT